MAKRASTPRPKPLADLNNRAEKAKSLLDQALALFPDAHALATDDRRRSTGRMGADESTALRAVLGAIDARPELFAVLADEDEGHDPTRVEVDLVRERFDHHDLYRDLAEHAQHVADVIGDTALAFGARVKPFAGAVYEMGKVVGKREPKVAEAIAAARDYYGANARAAAKVRMAKKAPK